MSDKRERELERAVAGGDPSAEERLAAMRRRRGELMLVVYFAGDGGVVRMSVFKVRGDGVVADAVLHRGGLTVPSTISLQLEAGTYRISAEGYGLRPMEVETFEYRGLGGSVSMTAIRMNP